VLLRLCASTIRGDRQGLAEHNEQKRSGRDCLKDAPYALKVFEVPLLGFARDLVEPTERGWLQAWFRRIISRVDYLNLDFYRIIAALHPSFSLLSSLWHVRFCS